MRAPHHPIQALRARVLRLPCSSSRWPLCSEEPRRSHSNAREAQRPGRRSVGPHYVAVLLPTNGHAILGLERAARNPSWRAATMESNRLLAGACCGQLANGTGEVRHRFDQGVGPGGGELFARAEAPQHPDR